jgi:hypothetical protein
MSDLKKRLEGIVASLRDRSSADVIGDIARLAVEAGNDACEEMLAAHPELLDMRPILTEANFRRIRDKDVRAVEQLLGLRPEAPFVIRDLLSEAGRASYDRVGDMFEYVDFSRCRRLVMVGCGPNPSTIFHVCDKTKIPEIFGLDVLPFAVEKARLIAERLGLSRVKIELCGGTAFDYATADIVFVANMVSPKASVLTRIADTAPANVQIVLREPHSLGRLWAECGEQMLDSRLEVRETARPSDYVALSRDVFIRRRVVAG